MRCIVCGLEDCVRQRFSDALVSIGSWQPFRGALFIHTLFTPVTKAPSPSFDVMDSLRDDDIASGYWRLTGCLFRFPKNVRIFTEVVSVLCINSEEPLKITSDIPVSVLESPYDFRCGHVYGYRKEFSSLPECSLAFNGNPFNLNQTPDCLRRYPKEHSLSPKLSSSDGSEEDEEDNPLKRHRKTCSKLENELEKELNSARVRIKALFKREQFMREKDPERKQEITMMNEVVINARNRIRELVKIDSESRKLKEGNKIEKNEIILEEPKFEDKKDGKLFEPLSNEDYFKGFDAFKEKLSAEFKKNLKKRKSKKNKIMIEGKKEDVKIEQGEVFLGKQKHRRKRL